MFYNWLKKNYALLPLAVLLAYFIYRAVGAPLGDFAGYYFGGRALLQGRFQQVYDTYSLNALIAQKGYTGVFVSYTPFPPFTALVLAPFFLFPVAIAKLVFNSCSALLLLFTLNRVGQFFNIPRWVLLLMPVVFFIPLRNNIFFGQAYLLLVVLLLEGYIAWKKERLWLASLLWAIAIVFKVFPLVLLFFLITKKQYKVALFCALACAGLGVLSLLINGWEAWQYYVFTILLRAGNGELNNSYGWLFQSAFMLLKNALVYDAMENPRVWYNSLLLFTIAMALFKAFILAGSVGIGKKEQANGAFDCMAFAGWITASLLLSPNGSSYSLILLLLPLVAIASERKRLTVWASVLLFIICTLPVQSLAAMPLLLKFPRLYLLLLFFILLMRSVPSQFPVKLFLAFFVLLALPAMRAPVKDDSVYLLPDKLPLLYDYSIKNNQLVYYYWDEDGSHENFTNYIVQQYDTVTLTNNQVYYKGKQLTSSPDLKKKPMLVNGNTIVYLSDKNRGMSFYTLRSINVVMFR